MLGFNNKSWAYHSDNGSWYHDRHSITQPREPRSDKFGQNDYVGCGIDITKGISFFTKNGKQFG
ncbi:hypothetical protein HDV63DRAFT_376510, partial [Trichoderma sp. SZMC 28014]